MSDFNQVIAELEAGSTDLVGCLSSLPDLPRDQQLQLVLADQKFRFQQGQACSIHHYLQVVPWLATEPTLQQQLIVCEFVLKLGSSPGDTLVEQFATQYCDDHPSLLEQLRERLDRWNNQAMPLSAFDALCDRFEEEIEAKHSPRIESWLPLAPIASRLELVLELLRMETYHQQRQGVSPDWSDYQQRFPDDAELIAEVQKRHTAAPIPEARGSFSLQYSQGQINPHDLTGSFISSRTVGDLRNGRYRFVRKLGEGAYGTVYLAQDMDLKRQVAVKVPSREALSKLVDVDSYLVEAQNAAALDHPHIVTVYDVGRTLDGSVYLISKFIDGCSLADWINNKSLDYRTIAQLLVKVATALHHAHQRRLIHRDIKPANILIEEATETPFVADFGLAIREEDYLQEGRIAGTPAYMSPEQVWGEGHRLDGRSDLFSLGVVMYQMLTGQLPFPGQTRDEVAREITTLEPPTLRSLKSDTPAELERICLKLLRKRASDRYVNGAELAEDLQAWLSPSTTQTVATTNQKITPRGLRSFTADDAGFFVDLLPGPRNRDGLPESIAFWKERIEQRDPDQTFTVGLLYGPSGCGKSSLVKAGLIPHLSPEVIPIYVEATPAETESRLLRQLHKSIPELPTELDLSEIAERIRRSDGPKVVLIVDQFEQWLYSHRVEVAETLPRALRQCDGVRLQAILMIRDDFYLAAARLMKEIDVPIVTDQNFKLVDLFDKDHAQNVLTRFGQAYGKLPENSQNLSTAQTDFLRQVVEGLSEGGKVVSVRLALLAEMLKGRDWVPETLTSIGGLDGIGVSFLDETFASQRSDARLRQHQEAVRGVLRALLPETGSDIKGTMCAEETLLEASGYANRPDAFHELMRILDGELRLVTPTDLEGSLKGEQRSEKEADRSSISNFTLPTSHFQLTHDYLVPSLREWLTRKQRESKKGRAELKLAERAATWAAKPENRQLPTLWEWITIRRLTEKSKWKASEQAVVRRATSYHLQRLGLGASALVLLAMGGLFTQREVSRRQELTRMEGLVGRLISAEPAQLPEIVRELDENPQTASQLLAPLLEQTVDSPDEKRTLLHVKLASVERDPSLVEPLVEELLTGKLAYVVPIRELLKPHSSQWSDTFWQVLRDETGDANRRFRAGLALAEYSPPSESEIDTTSKSESDSSSDSESKSWTEPLFFFMAEQLVSANAEFQPTLRGLLGPIRARLLPELERIFENVAATDAQRLSAANAFADYAASDVGKLSTLLAVATKEQYEVIYPLVAANPTPSVIEDLGKISSTLPPEDMGSVPRIAFGQRRANAAVTMLRLGEREKVLPVFDWTDDPEALTQFIFRCQPRGISVDTLLDLLDITTRSANQPQGVSPGFLPARLTNNARYALLLAIGEYAPSDIPPARREALVQQLADWYASDPSSGVHGAAGWLLRQLGEHEIVTRVDQTPMPYSPDREWFTLAITVTPTQPPKPEKEAPEEDKSQQTEADQQNEQTSEADTADDSENKTEAASQDNQADSEADQQSDATNSTTTDPATSEESDSRSSEEAPTMEADTSPLPPKTFYYTFIVQPSGEYTIGSLDDQPDRQKDEFRHTVTLTRPFALLDREITFEELIAFSPQYAGFMQQYDAKPTDAGFGADWYDSVAYCRWLGKAMGLPESDQSYAEPATLDQEQYVRDPQVTWAPRNWPLDLDKRGFRLPTESEWEVVTRSGSRTAYGFGSEVGLLDRFGWFTENSGKQVHPPKELRPSVRGLFDLDGNLFEWTHDWYVDFGESMQTDPLGAKGGSGRVYRGGSRNSAAGYCRAAYRGTYDPTVQADNFGFRLALSPSSQVQGSAEPESGGDQGSEAEADR